MPDTAAKPQGPASYFPSIEKKYGQPVAHWLGLLATQPAGRTWSWSPG